MSSQNVCHACVHEDYLSKLMKDTGTINTCSYCNSFSNCWPLNDLADAVDNAFEQHYFRTPSEPDDWQSRMIQHSHYEWEREGQPALEAIVDAVECSEEIAEDIRVLLECRYSSKHAMETGEEEGFEEEACYELSAPSSSERSGDWWSAAQSLKHEARFFNTQTLEIFKEIFGNLEELNNQCSSSILIEAGPEKETSGFFRARVLDKQKAITKAMERPDLELGPPPATMARSGRMNALGISVFYGADSEQGALSEVRPPVGAKVMIARFDLLRNIRLLDFHALERANHEGSIFDHRYIEDLKNNAFLRTLNRIVSRPILPSDEEFEYLPTQAVADFLASMNEPKIDGILFPSAQTAGSSRNVMLFHNSSRVKELDLTSGTKFDTRTENLYGDGWEAEYVVQEIIPKNPPEKPKKDCWNFSFDEYTNPDHRVDTLAVDIEKINVHEVNSVQFSSEANPVQRSKTITGSEDF